MIAPTQSGVRATVPQPSTPATPAGLPAALRAVPSNGPKATLIIEANGRRFDLNLSEELLIGRLDTVKGIHPDIDLGPEGGFEAGVSRRHAILAHNVGIFTIEDLGSPNGTFVNGRRIAPQTPTRLTNGDELICGTLRMRIMFK